MRCDRFASAAAFLICRLPDLPSDSAPHVALEFVFLISVT
jgi:hypothetical protein